MSGAQLRKTDFKANKEGEFFSKVMVSVFLLSFQISIAFLYLSLSTKLVPYFKQEKRQNWGKPPALFPPKLPRCHYLGPPLLPLHLSPVLLPAASLLPTYWRALLIEKLSFTHVINSLGPLNLSILMKINVSSPTHISSASAWVPHPFTLSH